MKAAAAELQFERAAELRDKIAELKRNRSLMKKQNVSFN